MADTPPIDLTPFGFTPTEGLVYGVLLREGPGTGYAVARAAGLARANAYAALEGLVTKGAARSEGERPKTYRPEPPAALIARLADQIGHALDNLSTALHALATPETTAHVELETVRGMLGTIGHDVARATSRVLLLAPADAYPLLVPSLRRPASAGVPLVLASTGIVETPVAPVRTVVAPAQWPGEPIVMLVDDRIALLGARTDGEVRGHWSTSPVVAASARSVLRECGLT
jgi:sugar-specific transcriptional regulator TrmB